MASINKEFVYKKTKTELVFKIEIAIQVIDGIKRRSLLRINRQKGSVVTQF